MTAGQGILHIETPPEHVVASGGRFHGLQLWVNLPKAQKLGAAALPGSARPSRCCCCRLATTAARWCA